MLHRLIDEYTDTHLATREAKTLFRPAYRLYAGAFVDIVYDHFLATDENEFDKDGLMEFSKKVYSTLDQHLQWLPPYFAGIFPYMRSQNWLYHYSEPVGIKKSFGGLVRRSLYLTESETAAGLIDQHYQRLGDCYRQFWKDMKPFARENFERLTQ